MRIYLGGPMTGIAQFNFPAFDAAEADLLDRGYDVVPPGDLHDLSVRVHALASSDGSLASLPPRLTWGSFLAHDVKLIADGGIEGVVLLPGWIASRGARLESFVARLCDLPVYSYGPEPLQPVSVADLQRAHGVASHPGVDDVLAFHRATDLLVGETPAIRQGQLRADLIREEARETVDAIEARDLVGTIDGLCDLLYVVYGAALTFGVDLEPFWREVHRSNMAKVGGPIREDGKRLKPQGWQPPDIAGILALSSGVAA